MSEGQAWRRWATGWVAMIAAAAVVCCWLLRPTAPPRYRYEKLSFNRSGQFGSTSYAELWRVDTETGNAVEIIAPETEPAE
jgi:hypothetical protein